MQCCCAAGVLLFEALDEIRRAAPAALLLCCCSFDRALDDCQVNLAVFPHLMYLHEGWDAAVTDCAALAERYLEEQADQAAAIPVPKRQQQQQKASSTAAPRDGVLAQPTPSQQQQQLGHANPEACSQPSSNSSSNRSSISPLNQSSRSSAARSMDDGSSSSSGGIRSSSSSDISSSSSAFSEPLRAVDPEAVEADVVKALEGLSERDVRFSRAELSVAWPPFGVEVGQLGPGAEAKDMRVFTDSQCSKLKSAGLNNLLKVRALQFG